MNMPYALRGLALGITLSVVLALPAQRTATADPLIYAGVALTQQLIRIMMPPIDTTSAMLDAQRQLLHDLHGRLDGIEEVIADTLFEMKLIPDHLRRGIREGQEELLGNIVLAQAALMNERIQAFERDMQREGPEAVERLERRLETELKGLLTRLEQARAVLAQRSDLNALTMAVAAGIELPMRLMAQDSSGSIESAMQGYVARLELALDPDRSGSIVELSARLLDEATRLREAVFEELGEPRIGEPIDALQACLVRYRRDIVGWGYDPMPMGPDFPHMGGPWNPYPIYGNVAIDVLDSTYMLLPNSLWTRPAADLADLLPDGFELRLEPGWVLEHRPPREPLPASEASDDCARLKVDSVGDDQIEAFTTEQFARTRTLRDALTLADEKALTGYRLQHTEQAVREILVRIRPFAEDATAATSSIGDFLDRMIGAQLAQAYAAERRTAQDDLFGLDRTRRHLEFLEAERALSATREYVSIRTREMDERLQALFEHAARRAKTHRVLELVAFGVDLYRFGVAVNARFLPEHESPGPFQDFLDELRTLMEDSPSAEATAAAKTGEDAKATPPPATPREATALPSRAEPLVRDAYELIRKFEWQLDQARSRLEDPAPLPASLTPEESDLMQMLTILSWLGDSPADRRYRQWGGSLQDRATSLLESQAISPSLEDFAKGLLNLVFSGSAMSPSGALDQPHRDHLMRKGRERIESFIARRALETPDFIDPWNDADSAH